MPITLNGSTGIGTPGVASTDAITGTTGTFSGNVTANGLSTELRPLVQGTVQNSTSGTAIDFTGIPSWVKRITVLFNGVSLSGTDSILVQIIVGGSPVTTGYQSVTGLAGANFNQASTSGFVIYAPNTTGVFYGTMRLHNVSGTTWVEEHSGGIMVATTVGVAGGGFIAAAGAINIMYE